MEIDLGNIVVIYPNEDTGSNRQLKIRTDGDILFFDFIDSKIAAGCFYLEKDKVELLVDTLKVILKNKLMD